jgi:transcriptional regulator with XRE-family HTH domain
MPRTRPAAARPAAPAAPRPRVSRTAGDEIGAAALGKTVAESLRKLRKTRQMSLDQLAAASGVSRAALSQIEGARTNPTLSVLWKIAVGLGVPFQSLLGTAEGATTRVLRGGDAQVLRSADGRMESRLLSPAGAAQNVDVYELRFTPKGLLQSEPHAAGTTETLIVLTGSLRVSIADETHDLTSGDSMFFHADVPHSYESRSSHETRCLDVVCYGTRV